MGKVHIERLSAQSQNHESNKREIPYSRNMKVLWRAKSPEDKSCEVYMQCGVFGYGGLNGMTAIFVTW